MIDNRHAELAPEAASACLQVTHGNPTAEELAVLAAIVSALGCQDTEDQVPSGTQLRRGRIRRRRELNGAPLPWKVGRH
ncbi:MAG: acyl-CoA carboxylase subunit epsilon [Micrococcaceae bacterium]|nr:acyl-CoA carboxylase subunit epsilon [Micrococcaceae bacterium]